MTIVSSCFFPLKHEWMNFYERRNNMVDTTLAKTDLNLSSATSFAQSPPDELIYEQLEPINLLIKNTRERKNISQEDLAKKCNISNVQLSRIEQGKCRPSIRTLCRLAPFLGYDLDDLLLASSYSGTVPSSVPKYINLEEKVFDLSETAKHMYRVDGELFLIFSDFIDNSNLEDIEMVKDLLTCMNTFYKNSNSIIDKKYETSIFDLFKNLKNYIFAFIKLFKLASAKEV